MARAPKSAAKPSLEQIPKQSRDAIASIMADRGGATPLLEFLAQRWSMEEYLKSAGMSAEKATQRVSGLCSDLGSEHPGWPPARIRAALSLSFLEIDLKESAVARRFTRDDPAELAGGLVILTRSRCLSEMLGTQVTVDFNVLMDACAVRDFSAVALLTKNKSAEVGEPASFSDLSFAAVVALGQKDTAKVGPLCRAMSAEKLRPWQEGVRTCLAGIAERHPQHTADGIMMLLEGIRKIRQADELSKAIDLSAHGLYALAEWIAPELVAGFDSSQPIPWDAGFHTWCREHPAPPACIDLRGISPALHDAIVGLQLPAEWTAT